MMTGQSIRICLRREVPTDHEAHSHTQRGQLRERLSYALSSRASAGLQPGGRSGNTTIQSRRVHDRGKPSRAKPDERCNAQKWTTRGTAESTIMPTTRWPTELWDHSSPRTVPGGRGVFLRVVLGSPRPRVARERACGGSARRSLWLGVWCAISLG